jgi:hypothetical protein
MMLHGKPCLTPLAPSIERPVVWLSLSKDSGVIGNGDALSLSLAPTTQPTELNPGLPLSLEIRSTRPVRFY